MANFQVGWLDQGDKRPRSVTAITRERGFQGGCYATTSRPICICLLLKSLSTFVDPVEQLPRYLKKILSKLPVVAKDSAVFDADFVSRC